MAARRVGILTAGGDSPGLNAAIRGFGKAAIGTYGFEVVGFRDGFRGLAENRKTLLQKKQLAGILTIGGTILGTSRDKPSKMLMDGEITDVTQQILEVCRKERLEGLVCLGGGGTAKNALRLSRAGLNVLTLPKTIDNDVAGTDATFGFATALEIATEAIDRLHSTAHSHHRIIVAEVMGHRAGWLTLGAGLAGGADVILIPEIPYSIATIANAIRDRVKKGTNFSIVAVAEGARNIDDAKALAAAEARVAASKDPVVREAAKAEIAKLELQHEGNTLRLTQQLEQLTGLESRVTILGLRPARRDAFTHRPAVGDATWHGCRGLRCRRHVGRHGGRAGRRDCRGAADEGGRPTQHGAAGPRLGAGGAQRGDVSGRLRVHGCCLRVALGAATALPAGGAAPGFPAGGAAPGFPAGGASLAHPWMKTSSAGACGARDHGDGAATARSAAPRWRKNEVFIRKRV